MVDADRTLLRCGYCEREFSISASLIEEKRYAWDLKCPRCGRVLPRPPGDSALAPDPSRSVRVPVGTRPASIPISTTAEIHGASIVQHVGFVSSFATMASIAPGERLRCEDEALAATLDAALEGIVTRAVRLGGNAIVGLTCSWVSANQGGLTIATTIARGDRVTGVLSGTAVLIDPVNEAPAR